MKQSLVLRTPRDFYGALRLLPNCTKSFFGRRILIGSEVARIVWDETTNKIDFLEHPSIYLLVCWELDEYETAAN
jgi:hypothetical protein